MNRTSCRPLLIFLFVLAGFVPAGAQRTLFSDEPDTTMEVPAFGPNRTWYVHTVMGVGAMPGPQEYGMQTNWWSSSFSYSIRTKLKLASWESLVLDFGYRYDRYSIRQDTPKLLPLIATRHQRERISVQDLSLAFCNRVNFVRRRGNVLGTYLDFGVYGDWSFRTTNVFVDQYFDSNSPSGYNFKSKTKISRLPYIEKFSYGFTARFGGDYAGVYALWRWNDLVKNTPDRDFPDLPKLTIGVEVYIKDGY